MSPDPQLDAYLESLTNQTREAAFGFVTQALPALAALVAWQTLRRVRRRVLAELAAGQPIVADSRDAEPLDEQDPGAPEVIALKTLRAALPHGLTLREPALAYWPSAIVIDDTGDAVTTVIDVAGLVRDMDALGRWAKQLAEQHR